MIVKLLTKHHLELLSFKGGCRGSSESTLVKMPHCWKSHATMCKKISAIIKHEKWDFLTKWGILYSEVAQNVSWLSRLALVLKTIFHQCIISYTCS